MSERNLVAIVATRAGGMPEDEAQAVVAAVAPAIAAACSERVTRRIASTLGEEWPHLEHTPVGGLEDIHRIVAARLGSSLVRAAELTRLVGEAIGEQLDGEDWALVRRDLLADVAAVLEPRAPRETHAPSHHGSRTSERTLADGAPGAERSIASTHHPIAQPASVDDEAQHDERLAAAHGTRQEERDETLATGRPGSSRPLSTGR